MEKEIAIEHIWSAAGVILGFQFTAFNWRLGRELQVGKEAETQIWLPVADYVNLLSMGSTVFLVFIMPIMNIDDIEFVKKSFGLSLILFLGYPFMLISHYNIFTPQKYNFQNQKYFPTSERITLIILITIIIIYILGVVI